MQALISFFYNRFYQIDSPFLQQLILYFSPHIHTHGSAAITHAHTFSLTHTGAALTVIGYSSAQRWPDCTHAHVQLAQTSCRVLLNTHTHNVPDLIFLYPLPVRASPLPGQANTLPSQCPTAAFIIQLHLLQNSYTPYPHLNNEVLKCVCGVIPPHIYTHTHKWGDKHRTPPHLTRIYTRMRHANAFKRGPAKGYKCVCVCIHIEGVSQATCQVNLLLSVFLAPHSTQMVL